MHISHLTPFYWSHLCSHTISIHHISVCTFSSPHLSLAKLLFPHLVTSSNFPLSTPVTPPSPHYHHHHHHTPLTSFNNHTIFPTHGISHTSHCPSLICRCHNEHYSSEIYRFLPPIVWGEHTRGRASSSLISVL